MTEFFCIFLAINGPMRGIVRLKRNKSEQECIPVGCVPAAHWPYAAVFFRGGYLPGPGGVLLGPGGGGVCLVWGGLPGQSGGVLLGPRGVCLVRGGSPWSRGVSAWSGGSPWSRGVLLGPGGVCLVWGGSPETPPVNRITDTCKNITLATTSLRKVIMPLVAMVPWLQLNILQVQKGHKAKLNLGHNNCYGNIVSRKKSKAQSY